ncbi:hypothetical protein DFQ29_006003, partial [Apophysomyces sp. BC1021]
MSLRKSCLALAWLLFLSSLLSFCAAFNLPGTGPRAFELNEEVPLLINKIFSYQTQLPYAYGDLPFVCKPKAVKWEGLNLGEVLQGDRIMKSDYKIRMGQNTSCLTLCDVSLSEQVSDEAAELIWKHYRVEWSVDNLPGSAFIQTNRSDEVWFGWYYGEAYFPLGQFGREAVYINNHMNLEFLYETSKVDPTKKYIVGFEVKLASYDNPDSCGKQANDFPMKEVGKGATTVTYTYSVGWAETTKITWADRWDRYRQVGYRPVWYGLNGLIMPLIITLSLTGMVNTILIRTLKRDITNYNMDGQDVEAVSEDSTGWKLIHGDVFRPPPWSSVLPPLLGSGVQFMSMMCGTI